MIDLRTSRRSISYCGSAEPNNGVEPTRTSRAAHSERRDRHPPRRSHLQNTEVRQPHYVVAADDPITADFAQHHGDWHLVAEQVDLHELSDGGHYFPRTRPTESAHAVLRSAESLSRSLAANR